MAFFSRDEATTGRFGKDSLTYHLLIDGRSLRDRPNGQRSSSRPSLRQSAQRHPGRPARRRSANRA